MPKNKKTSTLTMSEFIRQQLKSEVYYVRASNNSFSQQKYTEKNVAETTVIDRNERFERFVVAR